jgi:hypothetical protein
MRGDIVSESGPIGIDRESRSETLTIADRWHNLVVRIRETGRHPRRNDEETGQGTIQGLDVTSPPISRVAQAQPREDQSPVVIRSGGVVHSESAKTLPNSKSVVQAAGSQPALPSEPERSTQVPGRLPAAGPESVGDSAGPEVASADNSPEKSAEGAISPTGKPPVRTVSSKRIVVDYEIKDIGPSGVSTVDLWYTRDGRKWEKCPIGPQRSSPYILEVREEGLYGITLVASSGVGLKKRPPRPGDGPQIWIEVDTTKPLVRLTGCTVGTGAEADSMTITWKATDKHLGEKPITLSYAEQPEGPWSTIAANVENTGSYLWKMPTSVPQRLIVRMEATDMAGNVGMTQTRQPVLVDLAKPSVAILSIKPAAN